MRRCFLLTALPFAAHLATACGKEEKTFSREQLLDPETCKDCHADHYREWSGSMHAYASFDPVFLAMNQRGQEETDGKLGDFCVNCHAPLAVQEGYTTDGLNMDEVPDHLQGITCYFCHNVESVEGEHNNPLVLANDTVMRGGIRNPVENEAHESAYSALMDSHRLESSDMCGPCHDIMVPPEFSGAAAPVHLERTFLEWKETIFGDPESPGAESCGACHMNLERDVPVADAPGVVTRDFRRLHDFPGVDVALTPFPEMEWQLEEVQKFLDTVPRVEICVPITRRYIWVLVENFSAGHSFPSGASQDRRAWVEVRAYDSAGEEIYSHGVVQEGEAAAYVEPQPWGFYDRVFDVHGEKTHMFWDAAEVEIGTIPGTQTLDRTQDEGNTVTRTYETGPLEDVARITVLLRMRPMGLEILDDLIDSGHLDPGVRDVMPTFDILPNRGREEVTLEWTPEGVAAQQEIRTVGGIPEECVLSAR